MIYIIRGISATAKNMIGCSIAEFLTARPFQHEEYTIYPDRNNEGTIYKIFKGKQLVYKPERATWKEEYEPLLEVVQGKGTKKLHTAEYIMPDDSDNTEAYNNLVNEVNTELESNANVVVVSNIFGEYLENFKNDMDHDVKVITILRDPVKAFLMQNVKDFTLSTINEDVCSNIFIFDRLHVLAKYEEEADYTFRYEDIIDSGIIELEGEEIKLNKLLLSQDPSSGYNDWEKENVTKKNSNRVDEIKEILTTDFAKFVNDPEMPKDIAAHFGYSY